MKVNNHDASTSIAKAICIILMVIGHSGSFEYLNKVIYLFHMPCFFFLSGYLLKEKYFINVKLGFKKRILGLWWPCVKWGVLFTLFHNVFFQWHFYTAEYSCKEMAIKGLRIFTLTGTEQLLSGYWFLSTLLIVSIISLFVLNLWNRITFLNIGLREVVSLSCAFVVLAYVVEFIPFKIPLIGTVQLLATACYLAGYGYSKICVEKKNDLAKGMCLLVIISAVPLFFSDSITVHGLRIFPYFAVSMIGTMAVICFSRFLEHTTIGRVLNFIGLKTFYILTFHIISFKLVGIAKIYQYNMPWSALSSFPVISEYNSIYWIVYSLVGVIVPLILWETSNRLQQILKSKKNKILNGRERKIYRSS